MRRRDKYGTGRSNYLFSSWAIIITDRQAADLLTPWRGRDGNMINWNNPKHLLAVVAVIAVAAVLVFE